MSGTSPWDAQNLASKISKYRKDFRLFASEQLKVSGQPLNFWPCQTSLLDSVESQIREQGFARCVWLKARQVGASTLAQAIVAWRTMLWPNVNAIVIADEQERSRNLFEISRYFYDHLDDDIRPVGRYITKRELVFANPSSITRSADPGLRSRIVIESAHKKNIAIGSAWQIAHLSECARFRDPSVVLDGIIPAVHRVPGTVLILESSAEQAGTWFRDFCEQAERGANAFAFVFVPWYQQPEYQIKLKPGEKLDLLPEERHMIAEFGLSFAHIKWMREKLGEMANDWDLFRQNYPLTPSDAWITPGVQVFPPNVLRELKEQIRPPIRQAEVFPGPRILDTPNGRLRIWEEPKPDRAYDIGVDVAMGSGEDGSTEDEVLDNSCVEILERGTNIQVAEWVSKAVDPFEFATTLFWLGTYYNQGQIAVETNAIGGGTNQQLAKMGYCLTPDHKILTADLRWVPAGDLCVGDRLMGFDEKRPGPRRLRRYRASEVLAHELRKAQVYRIVLSDGSELKATGEHPWLAVRQTWSESQAWIETRHLRVGDALPRGFIPWTTARSYEAGWLAGILDGEGSAGHYTYEHPGHQSGHTHLSITQNPGPVLDEVCALLRRWGIQYGVLAKVAHTQCQQIQLSRKSDIVRLLGMVRPKRLLPKVTPDWLRTLRGEWRPVIEAVEALGEREIAAISTSTGTYVSDGFYSHNSNQYIWRYRDEVVPRYSRKTGWETNPKSKPWLVGFAIHESVNKRVQIRSELLYKEMTAFIQKGPREWGAVAGYHDDRVMAWMIALLTSDDENFERYYGLQKTGQNMKQAAAEASKPGPWEADLTFNKGNIVVRRDNEMQPWE